jgi:tRNA(Ile)-lysidine synthetase-like protein
MALAHLLVHYGRRVIPDRSQITLLHLNHGWRGEESDGDEAFVRKAAQDWGVGYLTQKMNFTPEGVAGQSWEDAARRFRLEAFQEFCSGEELLSGDGSRQVWTAHHADDQAETVLWRLFTGAQETHGGGIAFRFGPQLRPLLSVRKGELLAYLQEVGQPFREDSTNRDIRFLRANMRKELMPIVERLFPKAIEHLSQSALNAQRLHEERFVLDGPNEQPDPAPLLSAVGIRLRRSHYQILSAELQKALANPAASSEVHLPGGWRWMRHSVDHWTLERLSEKKSSFSAPQRTKKRV